MNKLHKLAQFGDGFEPISPGLTKNSNTNEGVVKDLELIISNALSILTILGGIFFVVYFFLAIYKILTAGGDSGKLSQAWQQILQAIIGLVLLVSAYAIVGLIGSVVGIDVINPGKMILELVAPL